MKSVLVMAFLLGLAAAAGCSTPGPVLSTVEMNAIETREADAGVAETFASASGALLHAGYDISLSDERGGLLVGRRSAEGSAGRVGADANSAVSISIRRSVSNRSAVRIRTWIDDSRQLDRGAIDEIWTLMQGRVLLNAPLAIVPTR